MDQNTASLIATIGVGILTVVTSVAVTLHQLNRQHRSSLALQEAHLRHQLQLDIFREVSDQLRAVAVAFSDADSTAAATLRQLQNQVQGRGEVSSTGEELSDAHFAAARTISDLLVLLERYEVVFYRFGTARRTLSDGSKRFHESYWELTKKLGLFLPVENGPRPHPFVPTPADVTLIEQATDEYRNVCGNFQGFVLDLQIEAQNCLLGELFQRKLPPRNPRDPTVPVLNPDSDAVLLARPPGRFV